MRFRSPPLLSLLLFFTSSACGTSHLAIGQSYLQRGNLPVAVEYFDAGLVEDAKNEELRDAMIMAEQSYQWQLRDDIDRLKDAGAYLLALARLTGLIERGHRLKTLRLPGEEPESLSQELRKITKKATKQLSIDLDKRAGRSQ
ncbi:MAG TPA: hypothetical protein EYN66_03035, partial [Myxococcales bacterium]|nr:hypothetical protein [Myxococcales bacterium]